MAARVNFSGLIVAGIGFFTTRFTVTLALNDDPLQFYFAGIVPLVLGLGLAAFGVALTVADLEPVLVRTTALWCSIGALAMLALVLLTFLGSTAGRSPDIATVRSQAYLSNFLIGGSVGGTFTGLYAARSRHHRERIQHQANRLKVLNRLLRHEILNAVTVIQGYVSTVDTDMNARSVIDEQSRTIEQTVAEVRSLVQTEPGGQSDAYIDIVECLNASIATVQDRHPDATISLRSAPSTVTVRATSELQRAFTHLLENAIVHAKDPAPTVEVTTTGRHVQISIRDTGPGLPTQQRVLLESGKIQSFDDPSTGFGLNLVRLIIEDVAGSIETNVEPDGTTITIEIPIAEMDPQRQRPIPSRAKSVRPAIPHLIVTLGAAVFAGVFYGIVSELLGGSIAGIGVFYGPASPVVGWLTHEFHSIVFGFVFAGLLSAIPVRYRNRVLPHILIGIAWATVLWIVAAGFIAPVWLRLLGIPASIPSFSLPLLGSHLAWGVSLGLLTALGYEYVTPFLANVGRWPRQRGSND